MAAYFSLLVYGRWFAFLNRLRSYVDRNRNCHTCPDCGAEFEPNYRTLKQTGHHRARVFYARVAMERRLGQLYQQLPVDAGVRDSRMSDRILTMQEHGIITKAMARRATRHWARASRVCHGEPCSVEQATRIVKTINLLLEDMRGRAASVDAVVLEIGGAA